MSNFLKDKHGATAIEYALIFALVAVVVVTVLNTRQHSTNTKTATPPSADAPLKN